MEEKRCGVFNRSNQQCKKYIFLANKCLEHAGTHICKCGRAIYYDESLHIYCWRCGWKIPKDKIILKQNGDKNRFVDFR